MLAADALHWGRFGSGAWPASPLVAAETPGHDMTDIVLRRAIVGTLLRASRPMSVAEIIATVLVSRPLIADGHPLTPKNTSDVLRYQTRIGRARRARRGVYEAIPSTWVRSTAWRYINWETSWDLRHAAPAKRTTPTHRRSTVAQQPGERS